MAPSGIAVVVVSTGGTVVVDISVDAKVCGASNRGANIGPAGPVVLDVNGNRLGPDTVARKVAVVVASGDVLKAKHTFIIG